MCEGSRELTLCVLWWWSMRQHAGGEVVVDARAWRWCVVRACVDGVG